MIYFATIQVFIGDFMQIEELQLFFNPQRSMYDFKNKKYIKLNFYSVFLQELEFAADRAFS